MRVLLVKLTSMGDLVHALPALTDAMQRVPDVSFDWVIDKNFSEVATWHPAVSNIFKTSHRSWRKHPWQFIKNGEITGFLRTLRQQKYDLVIDGQTNTKSAITMMLTRGTRCGYDKDSVREWIAHFAYQKKFNVPKDMHAILRLRQLFSQIFQYSCPETNPDYGIQNYPFPTPSFELPFPYLVFVHNASWSSKLWPLNYWHSLIEYAAAEHLNVLLPWGNESEKQRAEQLCVGHNNAYVLPFCSLSEHAWILQHAMGAVCSDTGLSHIAAALNVPSVTMYGSTSVKLIGTTGLNQKHIVTPFPCSVCYKHDCNYDNKEHRDPPCLLAIKPEMLWQQLLSIMTPKS